MGVIAVVTMLAMLQPTLEGGQESRHPEEQHATNNEIRRLIGEWYPRQVAKYETFDPLREIQKRVLDRARDSGDSRRVVIGALLESLEEPEVKTFYGYRILWYLVCDSLGELKATEAIDILVGSLNLDDGIGGMSVDNRPVVLGLIKIGRPAIPKLKNALTAPDSTQITRIHAAEALATIGGSQAKAALRYALRTETDEMVRSYLEARLR